MATDNTQIYKEVIENSKSIKQVLAFMTDMPDPGSVSGRWTPRVVGKNDAGSASYKIQEASFFKVSKLVFINCVVELSIKGNMDGPVVIQGLTVPIVKGSIATVGKCNNVDAANLVIQTIDDTNDLYLYTNVKDNDAVKNNANIITNTTSIEFTMLAMVRG